MTGRGRVPPSGDVSSGRGRGRTSDSGHGHGRGRASDSGGGHGSASDSGIGRGRASDSGAGRGWASDSGAGRGQATDSGARRAWGSDSGSGHGRASDSGIGPEGASNSSRGHGRGHTLELSPGYSRTLGRGYAGSSSHAGDGDPMADMQGVFRHQQGVSRHQHRDEFQHEGSGGSQHGFNMVRYHAESDDGDYHEEEDANATQLASNAAGTPHGRSQKEVIFRVGMRFENGKLHRAIRMLLMSVLMELGQHTEKSLRNMWTTRYSWDQVNDEFIREGFENVLKRRFPDIVLDHRYESAKKARNVGHIIPENEYDFGVMCEYPPCFVHEDIRHELCMWHKKSERGKSNRKKADSDGVISRHTGGSRGYDEHHIILVILCS
ncbi:hypothetical protein HanRHA438_Chr00c42g0857091 [Helianthus annuus]|nr:hypothetical protein HanRHA438_Chr00c42g0857091 [Helianthus annuus]